MAITTLAGVNTGLRPPMRYSKNMPNVASSWSAWFVAGAPPAGSADTSTASGVTRSSSSALVTGQIPHFDPAGGSNSYLAYFSGLFAFGTQPSPSMLTLCDRLWDCGANSVGVALSPTLLTAQTVNSAAWPTRDNNGASAGAGVFIALEYSATLGAGTSGWTISYTNSAGTASLTASNIEAEASAQGIGSFYRFAIGAADAGVKSVQSVTNVATNVSGQYVLVAFRVIGCFPSWCHQQAGNGADAITSGFPQLFNGTVPFICGMQSTSAATFQGSYQETQG